VKTAPVIPAEIHFDADGIAHAPRYGDVYHPRAGALQQARHVFLQGNGLPERWRGRPRFTILETGFGLGLNFIATWQAWRDDAARCERLCVVVLDKHPPHAHDLARAHGLALASEPGLHALAGQLQRAWPVLTPNVHVIDFEAGRLRLLLGFGDVADLLPELRLRADAFYLDGFAPACNAEMWQPRAFKALARVASPGATLATWSVARPVRDGLAAAGFDAVRAPGSGGKREITVARWAPRFDPAADPKRAPWPTHAARRAVVIGGGIAGAAAAAALRDEGVCDVTVIDRRAAPATETSGNPAGLFHATVHADDGRHARLFRAAALHAATAWAALVARGVPGRVDGLLRLGDGLDAMQALLQRQGLPEDHVQALDAAAASRLAGVAVPRPCWHWPKAGWIAPGDAARAWLGEAGLRWMGGRDVAALRAVADGWRVLDPTGAVIADADTVVVACAASSQRLLAGHGAGTWPLATSRGQVTVLEGPAAAGLRLPVAGDGYAIPLPAGRLLCGATHHAGVDLEPGAASAPDDADHAHNLQRLQRLTGLDPHALEPRGDRVGWRLHTDDALPIAGPLPLPALPRGQRLDQARLLPRAPGLFVLTALGGRGLTLVPLLARLVAAQATGAPWPLEQDLVDAVDPARWQVRAVRRGGAGG
jgi:tRNA 5-methylaminomethyl-2-thiouridine biosynthesis bifunctional protein